MHASKLAGCKMDHCNPGRIRDPVCACGRAVHVEWHGECGRTSGVISRTHSPVLSPHVEVLHDARVSLDVCCQAAEDHASVTRIVGDSKSTLMVLVVSAWDWQSGW